MATKEQLVTFALITFFLFGIAGFNYYLESKVYSEIRLSPGGSEISYIFYISLGVIWVIITLIIFINNNNKLTKHVINEKRKLPVKKLLRNNKK